MVYLAMALTVGLIWFLYRTRAGLVLRSVGESPESAHALGYPVRRIRFAAVVAGGALCGLAGAYLSIDLHAAVGRGHGGRPRLDRAGAHHLRHLAAGARAAGRLPVRRRLDAGVPPAEHGREVPSQFLTCCRTSRPIVVLALISRNPALIRINMPASLGKPFYPGS